MPCTTGRRSSRASGPIPRPRGRPSSACPSTSTASSFRPRVIKMNPPYGKDEIIDAIKDTVRANGARVLLHPPAALLFLRQPRPRAQGLARRAGHRGLGMGRLPGREGGGRRRPSILVPWRRVHHSQIDMRAKLGGDLRPVDDLRPGSPRQGLRRGRLPEHRGPDRRGPGREHLHRQGRDRQDQRAGSESILEGITRTSVLEIAADLGYKTADRPDHQGRASSAPTRPSSPGPPSRSSPSSG